MNKSTIYFSNRSNVPTLHEPNNDTYLTQEPNVPAQKGFRCSDRSTTRNGMAGVTPLCYLCSVFQVLTRCRAIATTFSVRAFFSGKRSTKNCLKSGPNFPTIRTLTWKAPMTENLETRSENLLAFSKLYLPKVIGKRSLR